MNFKTINKEYVFQIPKEKLWELVAVNENLINWLADKVKGRPNLGAKFTWSWHLGIEGELETNGFYKEIIPGKKIVLHWDNHPAGEIELMLEFVALDEKKSKLILVNSGYPEEEKNIHWIEAANDGWDEQAKRLSEYISKLN